MIKAAATMSCFLLLACAGENEKVNQAAAVAEKAPEKILLSQEALDDMMQSLPQPIEIAQIISSSSISINKNTLIPSDNAEKYSDKYMQAMALGAYGVDLGYLNLNNQTLYQIEYLEEIKNLSEKLRVEQFFDFANLARLAKNRKNTDSLIEQSTQNFNRIDQYLREQNRGELSVLILVGAWIEGMNMFAEISKTNPSDDISQRIAEQKIVFDNVYLLLGKLNNIAFFAEMEKTMTPLRIAYDKVKITYNYKKPIMKEVNGQLVLKDQTEMKVDFSAQDIANIIKELQKVRNTCFIK